MPREARERFERLFVPEPNTGCWLWTGSTDPAGYGRFLISKKRGPILAHRAAVELYTGVVVPKGVLACHRCDTPGCVNPVHIFLGTHLDNRRDSIVKGRHDVSGARNPSSRLTVEIVAKIRERCEAGESQSSIARALEINQSTVSRISRRERWARS